MSSIHLRWTDNSNNEDGFIVERCEDLGCPNNFEPIKSLGPNTTALFDGGLFPDTFYRYRVRAFNASGNSAYSNVANVYSSGRNF